MFLRNTLILVQNPRYEKTALAEADLVADFLPFPITALQVQAL
jgi:hypothetical protein